MSPEAVSLGGLFVSAFTAATLLPGGSEIVFAGVILLYPDITFSAIFLATLGNTLGGMTTYWLARLFPRPLPTARLQWAQRYGSAILLLSWVPLIGDILCAAAGLLRLRWPLCMLWMSIGKGLRYALLAWLVTTGAQ